MTPLTPSQELWRDMNTCPVTSFVIIICLIFFFFSQYLSLSPSVFGFSYSNIVHSSEYWRIFSSSFSHASLIHLIFNLSALWSLRSLEIYFGSLLYFKVSFVILVFSIVICLFIYYILFHFWKYDSYRNRLAVGYSGVIFGLITIYHQILVTSSIQKTTLASVSSTTGSISIFGLSIPIFPFFSLLITQILVPNASFVGHLSGIFTSFFIVYGYFDNLLNNNILFSFFVCTLIFGSLFTLPTSLMTSFRTTSILPLYRLDSMS